MPGCVVTGCTSRSSSQSSKKIDEKCHFFKIPQGKLDDWKIAIRRENDSAVDCQKYVCQKHFTAENISWGGEMILPGGKTQQVGDSFKLN